MCAGTSYFVLNSSPDKISFTINLNNPDIIIKGDDVVMPLVDSPVPPDKSSEIVRFRVCKHRIVENIVKNRNNLPEQTSLFVNLLERRTVELNEASVLFHPGKTAIHLTKFIFA